MNRLGAAVARLDQSRQRLRSSLAAAPEAGGAAAMLGGLVQRHPVLAATLAALAGALLSSGRSWRWLFRAELVAALLPSVLAAMSNARLSGWAELLAAVMRPGASAAPAGPPKA